MLTSGLILDMFHERIVHLQGLWTSSKSGYSTHLPFTEYVLSNPWET